MTDVPIRVGDVIGTEDGFCGHFGRDGYGAFRVESVGSDWVVARHLDGPDEGMVRFYSGPPDDLIRERR